MTRRVRGGHESVEQLGRRNNYGRGARRWIKRFTAKLMRRLGRERGDDAPKRIPFRGFQD